MSTLRKTTTLGLGTLGLSLMASTAMAAGTNSFMNASPITYATEAVKAASGQITIPAGEAGLYVATATQASPSSGAFTLTFTLPPGVTPTGSTVNATVTPTGVTCGTTTSQLSGSVSGQTITFTVTTNTAGTSGDTCQVSLNSFTVTGATALETPTALSGTPGSGFPIKAQLTASGSSFNPFNTDASPQPADLAGSKSGLAVSGSNTGIALADVKGTFDGVAAPYKVFASGSAAVSNTGMTVASLSIANSGAFDTSGAAVYSLGAPATVTVSGNISGFDGFYLDPVGGSCAGTESDEKKVANVITGTPSGSTATLSGITLGNTNTLCGYVSGSSLIGANAGGLSLGVSAGPASTTKGGSATAFNGGVPFIAAYSGNISSYPTFLRIVNGTGTKQSVICDIQADNGSEGVTLAESGLAPSTNDLVAVSTLISSAGVTTDSSGRAALYCAPSANGVLFEHMMLNPDGTVTQIGSDINTAIATISLGYVGIPSP